MAGPVTSAARATWPTRRGRSTTTSLWPRAAPITCPTCGSHTRAATARRRLPDGPVRDQGRGHPGRCCHLRAHLRAALPEDPRGDRRSSLRAWRPQQGRTRRHRPRTVRDGPTPPAPHPSSLTHQILPEMTMIINDSHAIPANDEPEAVAAAALARLNDAYAPAKTHDLSVRREFGNVVVRAESEEGNRLVYLQEG